MNEFERRLKDEVKWTDYIASFGDQSKEIAFIDNYSYVISYHSETALITQAPMTFPLLMDTDSDFVMTSMSGQTGYVNNASSGVTESGGAMLLQILDQLSGRTYFNIPTMMPLVCGDGGFPFLMPSPRIVYARGILQVTAQSAFDITPSGSAGFNRFYLSLNGSRIFYK